MKRVLFILLFASISFAQNIPNKIGNLSKSDFEKWAKSLNLEGHKFMMFGHEEDSFQAMYLKGESTVVIIVREDDGSAKDDMMTKMGYKNYIRKGLKHYLNVSDLQTVDNLIVPKYKIFFSIGMQGNRSKELLDKILDQTKIYEK
jgi:hypothetical protein